jgi:hypothetical protein
MPSFKYEQNPMILISKRGSRYIVTLVCLIVDLSF